MQIRKRFRKEDSHLCWFYSIVLCWTRLRLYFYTNWSLLLLL